MFIVLHCGGIAFNGDTIKTRSLGGSETAAYHLARQLAKAGHRVRLFTNSQETGNWDGVEYMYAGVPTERAPLGDQFHFYASNTPHDVTIVQRHPFGLREKFASKQCYLWLHDLVLARNKPAYDSGCWQMNGAFVVSEFHKAQVEKILNVQPYVLKPVTNGVDPERFEKATVDDGFKIRQKARLPLLLPHERIDAEAAIDKAPAAALDLAHGHEFAMLYSSRPERGLENLVRPGGIMDQLRQRAPNAHLYVCRYEHDVPEMREFVAGIEFMARQLPNVTFLGHLKQDDLASVMKSVQLHIYPTQFEEVSCITAMECMHAGLPMLVSRHAAIPETCKGAGVVYVDLKDGQVDIDQFVTHAARIAKKGVLGGEYRELVARQLKTAPKYTWEATAKQVLGYVEEAFRKATSKPNHPALLRHLIRHSDVQTARHLVAQARLGVGRHPIIDRCLKELELYEFVDDPVAYAAHYAKGCAAFYDGPEYKGPEDSAGHPRFECVSEWVGAALSARAAGADRRLVVVDLGCAHGHYTVGLARRFPAADFVGLDVSPRAVEEARKAAAAAGVANCRFEVADGVDWRAALTGGFAEALPATGTDGPSAAPAPQPVLADVVVMGEVLEHVLDSHAWATGVLTQIARPGAHVVFTTPIGPWEELSYQKTHPTRFHVQHFERADLEEMFGHFPGFDLNIAPNVTLANGDFIGNFCGRFDWDGTAARAPDLDRKLATQMPRETLTLGMIVKNGEATLRKTLDALVDVVDEVVIAIDEATTDGTEALIESIRARRPIWPIFQTMKIRPALETGFDEARNATLERASCDWFLWCDADEDPVRAAILPRYLRPNCFNGYAVPQHHFAVEPAGILMTDLPSRLFRVSCGATFQGRVHEHPEIGDNQGVGAAMVLPGFHLAHHGYYTEEIRRGRFQRNISLMQRDRKEYPNRKLGKYLWIRDLSHMIGFTLEQTGGRLDGQQRLQLQQMAREAILLFQELLKEGELRIVVDALQYYTNAVKVLGGGVELSMRLDIQRGQPADALRAQEVRGTFADRSHAERLASMIFDAQMKHFDTKYW